MDQRPGTLLLPLAFLFFLLMVADVARAQGKLEARTPDGTAVKLDLAEEHLSVRLDAQHARTTLRQAWNNPSSSRVEGSYRLQAGESSTVAGFSYWNGEQKIVGEVFEKQEAREVYEDVTGMGNDPGLLEQEGEGAFSFRVFPIEPGERKRVEVIHDRWMARAGRTFTYRAHLGRASAAIDVSIASPERIGKISSPTHSIHWDGKGKVMVGKRIDSGHDFILQIQHADPTLKLSGSVHRNAGHDGYVVMSVSAPTRAKGQTIAAKDVTLVIDRSGSMSGEPLRNAKAAAEDVVARLPATDRVNVIVFDDGVDALYSRPKLISDDVRSEVLAFVDRIQDNGGTDIAGALQKALALQDRDDRPDIVVFLTDGQSDSQAALKAARADAGDTRVFTVGVGSGVDKPLLSRLADEKRGRFTFVSDAGAIEPAMNRLYDRIANPLVVNLALESGGRLERVYPKTLPDLFQGDEVKIVARVRGTGPLNIALTGQQAGKEMAMKTTLAVPRQTIRPWVGRQWAMTRVEDLLQEIALQGETEELKNEVLELSLAYELTGPYTSFLAIPETELTDTASSVLADARARKEALLAANQDALALSRSIMPPGDPVLKVRAPGNARQVIARFSFGEVHDLQWDPDAEQWTTRFLVPKGVKDGAYDVKVTIVHADGRMEMGTTSYTIDSEAPEIEVEVEVENDVVRVTVTGAEDLREVFLTDADAPGLRVKLDATDDKRVFTTELPAADAPVRIRVLAADEARNEAVETVALSGATPGVAR